MTVENKNKMPFSRIFYYCKNFVKLHNLRKLDCRLPRQIRYMNCIFFSNQTKAYIQAMDVDRDLLRVAFWGKPPWRGSNCIRTRRRRTARRVFRPIWREKENFTWSSWFTWETVATVILVSIYYNFKIVKGRIRR